MLKFKKKNTTADNPQGISAQGNALHKTWVRALLAILIPVAVGFSYLLLWREGAVQDEQIQRTASTYAVQQTANIELLLGQFQHRLTVAATSPLALSAINSLDPDDIALIEKATMDYFPEVISLRLIPLGPGGTSALTIGNTGLRNNIELDLLRKTGEGGETAPESYQFESKWVTSLAELIVHPRDSSRRAVLLATFDNKVITDTLAAMDSTLGHTSLQQVYRSGNFSRSDEIASAGSGSEQYYQTRVLLNADKWTLVYTPSIAMLDELQISGLPLIAVLVVCALAIIGALIYLLVMDQRMLVAEVEKISAGADKKTPLELMIPELLPLAKQLRRATLRHVKRPVRGGRKPAISGAPGADFSDPMFQADSIVDEDVDQVSLAAEMAAVEKGATRVFDDDFPNHIFRAYDIRGLAGAELDEDLVVLIGKALGTLAHEQGQQALIVGCDGRTSSPKMKLTLIKALLDSGRDIIDIGIVPTPLLYYATHTLDTRSGIMVTGSHNPAEYNGFKMVIDGKTLSGAEIELLRDRILEGKFSEGAGRLLKQDVFSSYIEAVVGDMAIATPLKLVIDAGNGVTGGIAPILMEELGCEVVPLFCEVDGNFPNHNPDPSVESNLADLQRRVIEEEADLGIAFDGDGDRLAVVSAQGNIVRTDKLLMLFAQDVVSRNPGADVVFDVKCSRHLTQLVSRYGGRPILWKTGHAYMKEKMQETGALLGGEFSGHIFFGERWYGFDDGMYAAARLAEILSTTDAGLESLLEDFPDTENTPEIRIPVPDDEKFELMERLSSEGDFSPGKINDLDGIRVDYNDGWGLVRASNTGPALTARFEAHDLDALERIMQQFREQLAKAAPELDPGF